VRDTVTHKQRQLLCAELPLHYPHRFKTSKPVFTLPDALLGQRQMRRVGRGVLEMPFSSSRRQAKLDTKLPNGKGQCVW
jgi:hypothetical protein